MTRQLKWLRDWQHSTLAPTKGKWSVGEGRSEQSTDQLNPKQLNDCSDRIFQIELVAILY